MKKNTCLILIAFLSLLMSTLESRSKSWTNNDHGVVGALAFDANGNLYASAYFTTAGDVTANRIAKWNGSTWTNLGSGMMVAPQVSPAKSQ